MRQPPCLSPTVAFSNAGAAVGTDLARRLGIAVCLTRKRLMLQPISNISFPSPSRGQDCS